MNRRCAVTGAPSSAAGVVDSRRRNPPVTAVMASALASAPGSRAASGVAAMACRNWRRSMPVILPGQSAATVVRYSLAYSSGYGGRGMAMIPRSWRLTALASMPRFG
jgi:hypothetical protein